MRKPDIAGAMDAFELLREQLEETKGKVDGCAAESARSGDYDRTREWIAKGEGIHSIISQADALRDQLAILFDSPPTAKPPTLLCGKESLNPVAMSGGDSGKAVSKTNTDPPVSLSSLGNIQLMLKNNICNARAVYSGGSVVVLGGSIIAAEEKSSLVDNNQRICELRRRLRKRGMLATGESHRALVLKTDCRFRSPSGAACFVVGYSTSGNRDWLVEDTRKSLGEMLSNR